MKMYTYTGLSIAILIIISWFSCLSIALQWSFNVSDIISWLWIPILTHLYTGLFITAHDGMHHTITRDTKINHFIGWFCALLFAFNDYYRLLPKHHEHHRFVATEKDPDYYNGNFWAWYFSFLSQYLTLRQFILMAITFNLLLLFFPLINLILYWMLPAILSTFQLFYFGTYLPHKNPETLPAPHYARSQRRNHLFAFISCYFFGYHFEHHRWPGTPWWQLYKRKA